MSRWAGRGKLFIGGRTRLFSTYGPLIPRERITPFGMTGTKHAARHWIMMSREAGGLLSYECRKARRVVGSPKLDQEVVSLLHASWQGQCWCGGDTPAMSFGEGTVSEYECCCEDWNFRGDVKGDRGFMALGCESIKGFPVFGWCCCRLFATMIIITIFMGFETTATVSQTRNTIPLRARTALPRSGFVQWTLRPFNRHRWKMNQSKRLSSGRVETRSFHHMHSGTGSLSLGRILHRLVPRIHTLRPSRGNPIPPLHHQQNDGYLFFPVVSLGISPLVASTSPALPQ